MKKTDNTEKKKINVKVHIPENVPDSTKQRKINRLYDILKPKGKSSA